MFRSNLWALKNKTTGKLVTQNEFDCRGDLHEDGFPAIFESRSYARENRRGHSVVKVAVTVRKAA